MKSNAAKSSNILAGLKIINKTVRGSLKKGHEVQIDMEQGIKQKNDPTSQYVKYEKDGHKTITINIYERSNKDKAGIHTHARGTRHDELG